jgi:hypothetical protein
MVSGAIEQPVTATRQQKLKLKMSRERPDSMAEFNEILILTR